MGPQFLPLSSILLNVTSAASTGVQPSTGGLQMLEFQNLSSMGAWVKIAASSTGFAALPTTALSGAVADQLYLSTGGVPMRYACRPNPFISGITTAAGTCQLKVTAGQAI